MTAPPWSDAEAAAALAVYLQGLAQAGPDWPRPRPDETAAQFFAGRFRRIVTAERGLLTGYYEPVLPASLQRSPQFPAALYALPTDPHRWSRAEIEAGECLAGQEIAFVESPLEAFLAQVQGSLRLQLKDGQELRLGFAGKNGRPYRSIGQELVARGAIPAAGLSAQAIRAWCAAHPEQVADLLRLNPSFVFFRRLDLPPGSGPLGAMGLPLTAMRSLAADPAHIPPGAPVWIDSPGFSGLTVAQDQGGAIRGPDRADLFCGTGAAAGAWAGSLRLTARIETLLPQAAA